MYAIYEDASTPSTNSIFRSSHDQKEESLPTVMTPSATPPTRDKENRVLSSAPFSIETKNEELSSEVLFKRSPGICRKMNKGNHHRHGDSLSLCEKERQYSTLPHLRRHPKVKSEPSSNPLLDTISVLTYDPCDSDDYCDLTSVYEQRKGGCDHEEKSKDSSHHPHQGVADGDRDSIGYAGSSSIDSGYKSFCPTPEIPDSIIYGADRTASSSSSVSLYTESSNSSISSQGRGNENKSKVPMGTKVISRQSGLHIGASRDPQLGTPGSRRSDSSLYDVNLDHLMYLRQSLLSAIQKCESSASREASSKCFQLADRSSASDAKCGRSEHATSHGSGEETCSANACARKKDSDSVPSSVAYHSSSASVAPSYVSPTYQKTVRFNTDVKVTTVASGKANRTEDAGSNPHFTAATNDRGGGQYQNGKSPISRKAKSILKDPLCANLRSQLESGNVDCTLEEEIDSLLYGRAEFYDLESVNEFPCSYVTMIEEKYRSCKPSLAKVRKLKGGKLMDCSKLVPTSEHSSAGEDDRGGKSQKESQQDGSTPTSVSSEASTTCRFTEVARCMLEIIEDLQLKKLGLESGGKRSAESVTAHSFATSSSRRPSTTHCAEIHGTDSTRCSSETYIPVGDSASELQSGTSASSCGAGYTSASEYHVYEEITYDFVGHNNDFRHPSTSPADVPPPLPARPNTLLQKFDSQHRISKSSSCTAANVSPSQPHSRKDRNSRKQSFVSDDGSVRDRPKQRSNLYSLFADQSERRNISRSLEREWRVASGDGSGEPEDEYGFRRNYPSV